MPVSVVIAHYDDNQWLETTLTQLRQRYTYPDLEIVVVDDKSPKPPRILCDFYKAIMLQPEEKLNCAGCRNYGADYASGEYILFLDPHMVFPDGDWIGQLTDGMRDDTLRCAATTGLQPKHSLLTAGATFFPWEPSMFQPRWRTIVDNHGIIPVPCVLGACYLINANFFRSLGGFTVNDINKTVTSKYLEPEMSMKVWAAGGTCDCNTDVVVGHEFREFRPLDPYWTFFEEARLTYEYAPDWPYRLADLSLFSTKSKEAVKQFYGCCRDYDSKLVLNWDYVVGLCDVPTSPVKQEQPYPIGDFVKARAELGSVPHRFFSEPHNLVAGIKTS